MRKWTAQSVSDVIKNVHRGTVTLKFSTFDSVKKKATFIDSRFGEWQSTPRNVMKGTCHPKRSPLKRKETNLKKYGHECNLNSKEGIAKKKKTWLKNYNVDNPSKSTKIKKKKEATLFKNYGVKNPQQSMIIRKKIVKTCLKIWCDNTISI